MLDRPDCAATISRLCRRPYGGARTDLARPRHASLSIFFRVSYRQITRAHIDFFRPCFKTGRDGGRRDHRHRAREWTRTTDQIEELWAPRSVPQLAHTHIERQTTGAWAFQGGRNAMLMQRRSVTKHLLFQSKATQIGIAYYSTSTSTWHFFRLHHDLEYLLFTYLQIGIYYLYFALEIYSLQTSA